jgi:hypothetical protein
LLDHLENALRLVGMARNSACTCVMMEILTIKMVALAHVLLKKVIPALEAIPILKINALIYQLRFKQSRQTLIMIFL